MLLCWIYFVGLIRIYCNNNTTRRFIGNAWDHNCIHLGVFSMLNKSLKKLFFDSVYLFEVAANNYQW